MTSSIHVHHDYRLVQVKLLWLQASLGKTLQARSTPGAMSSATVTLLACMLMQRIDNDSAVHMPLLTHPMQSCQSYLLDYITKK